MFNWLTATSSPRRLAGAISVIYIGQTTDAPPTATPPSQRKKSSAYQFQASAQPTADTTTNKASSGTTDRPPAATPPRQGDHRNPHHFQTRRHANGDTTNNKASSVSTGLRPHQSAG